MNQQEIIKEYQYFLKSGGFTYKGTNFAAEETIGKGINPGSIVDWRKFIQDIANDPGAPDNVMRIAKKLLSEANLMVTRDGRTFVYDVSAPDARNRRSFMAMWWAHNIGPDEQDGYRHQRLFTDLDEFKNKGRDVVELKGKVEVKDTQTFVDGKLFTK